MRMRDGVVRCRAASNISGLVNDEGSKKLVAVASAAGTWTDSAR